MTDDVTVDEDFKILETASDLPSAASKLIARIVGRCTKGTLILELPSGERVVCSGEPAPEGILKLKNWRSLRRLVARGDIGFAEGYMNGDWTSPDLAGLFHWVSANEKSLTPAWAGSSLQRMLDSLRHALRVNTKRGSRRNIAEHYDLGNAFYAAWLDAGMNYSSAIYTEPSQSLESAQLAKLDRVVDLLNVSPDMSVLEIGCGWGALAEKLITENRCRVTGLTLSQQQLTYARNRLAAVGATQSGSIVLQDYRDTTGIFDRVVSIEMLEATGEAYWPTYFEKIRNSLVPGGTALLQVITIEECRFADYRRRPDFIQRYIFPGGMLPTVGRLNELALEHGFSLEHMELFGQSYADTLCAWRERFMRAKPRLSSVDPERFRNMWEYYLAYCEVGFRNGALDVGLYKLVRR